MARLNEVPHPTDSYDTLRRKLLRQNRELARVNSTQSLRIRHLENECARMLSENLDLRGQILSLEKEVESSQAQRVADHALEIKAKLEAQLVEWGGLLAGLGCEPPAKRRDVGRRMSSSGSRGSMGRRSPRKSLRDLAREAEARAREEGRLTPIREHKSYPRRTMDEEIMALRSEAEAKDAADISGSSDIGPPPTSRYAEPESPQKDPDSPSRPPQREEIHEEPHDEAYDEAHESIPESPMKPQSPTPVAVKEEETDVPSLDTMSDVPQAEPATVQNTQPGRASKAGAKRKLAARDDSENLVPGLASAPSATTRKKATITRERTSTGKALKDVTASKREERAKQAPAVQAPALRKPLSAKSTNDDLMSPKKNTRKAVGEKPLRPTRAKPAAEKQAKEPSKRRLTVLDEQVALPPAEPPIITTIPEPEPEPQKQTEPTLITPDPETHLSPTPEPKSSRQSRDTPPPADISSSGETSRPSRRSRSQVSYAEPNLRDKMRRPSKQLVDAVVESRGRRGESLAPEEVAAMEEAAGVKRESGGEALGEVLPRDADAQEPVAEAPGSPLARKGMESLPSSVVTERRKRRSSVLAREVLAENAAQASHDDSLDSSMSSVSTADIYDFPATSPEADAAEAAPKKTTGSRRASRAGHELSRQEEEARPSRKRASMNVVRRPKLEEVGGGDAVGEGVRDRSMRRRSTML